MHTAELEPGMWVNTPLGRAQVLTNQPVYSRKGTYYWRTVLAVLCKELETLELHIVSHAGYPWAE